MGCEMRRAAIACVIWSVMASVAVAASKPILLVTPSGVYLSEVVDGVPGPWVPQNIDVIVQGFPTGPNPPGPDDPPIPPETDPVVSKVATLSKDVLKTEENGQAAAALVDTLGKQGLSGVKFTEALHLTAPIMDSQMGAKGKISAWSKQVTDISDDPVKISSGVRQAFSLSTAELDAIARAVRNPDEPVAEEALDFASIIKIIQMILELLKNLGVIG